MSTSIIMVNYNNMKEKKTWCACNNIVIYNIMFIYIMLCDDDIILIRGC